MAVLIIVVSAISIIGIVVIVWGALTSFIKLLYLEYMQLKGNNICKRRELLRHHFGAYLLLGLEFMIAADIIHTIAKPDMEGLIVLASIVGIRTILSYFLNREVAEGHDCIDK
jgi:uncharacterized membrane protein